MQRRPQNLTNTQTNPARDSSFELLRIISLFSIVICHFATHGGFDFEVHSLSISRLWWLFLKMGGNFGVDVFVLISGYFLITSQKSITDNIRKILKFWGQVFFYSVGIYLIFGLVGINSFSDSSLLKTVLPLIYCQWWFASTYFVLFLIHPFLNILLNKLDKKQFQSLVIMLITMWCIIPTITESTFQSNNLLWFITLYSVAGYIRVYGSNPKHGIKTYILFFILFSSLRYFSSILIIILGRTYPSIANRTLLLYGRQSILTFASAVSLFLVFREIKMGYHKWINVIASACFGVYLIHDNNLVRPFLWHTVFHNSAYQNTAMIIPYSICAACLIYSVCTVIDLIRQKTVEKAFMHVVNKESDNILSLITGLADRCRKKVFGN